MWYRVFGQNGETPSLDQLQETLSNITPALEFHFRGDDLGWTGGEIQLLHEIEQSPLGSPIQLQRYLSGEDEIRNDLNSWAGWLETLEYFPDRFRYMELMIQSQQLFTLRSPLDHANEILLEKIVWAIVKFLAISTNGFIQIDEQGLFTSNGKEIVKEY